MYSTIDLKMNLQISNTLWHIKKKELPGISGKLSNSVQSWSYTTDSSLYDRYLPNKGHNSNKDEKHKNLEPLTTKKSDMNKNQDDVQPASKAPHENIEKVTCSLLIIGLHASNSEFTNSKEIISEQHPSALVFNIFPWMP